MIKYLKYILAFLLLSGLAFAQEQRIQPAPDAKNETLQFFFKGAWLPSLDPAEIGPENYSNLKNLRYGPADMGLEGVQGYSKINTTTALGAAGYETYLKIRNGYQLKTDRTVKSYVIVQAENAAETASQLWVNETAVPDQGDFAATTEVELDTSGHHYRTDTTGAGLGRFSDAPDGMTYCNGIECLSWSGEEMFVGGFYTATTATEVLDEVGFATHVEWDVTGQWADSAGADTLDNATLTYAAGDIGGTLQQVFADLASAAASSTEYYFSYTVTIETAIAGGTVTLVLTGGDTYIPAATVTLPQTAGRHTVTFITDDSSVSTGKFTITATEVGTVTAGIISLDDLTLQKAIDNPFDVTDAINNELSTTGNTVTIEPDTRGSWLVLTTRKIQGVYYDVSTANLVASAMTVEYWKDDATWAAVASLIDGTSASSKSLGQDGWVTFDYTSDAEPYHFEGKYLYAYKFHLGDVAGTSAPVIKYVTVNAPMQPIVDLWDGVPRQPIAFQVWRNGDGVFKDWTLEVNEYSYESVPLVAQLDALAATGTDYIIVMADDRLSGIQLNFMAGFVNEDTSIANVLYWNGSAYTAVTEVDGTSLSGVAFGKNGILWWSPPAESSEALKTEFGKTGYSYKIDFSVALSGTYVDESDIMESDDDVALDVVTLIPAQKTVPPFKFPSQYKNRVLLCGDTQGKQGDRCYYSQTGSTEIWNGLESSDDGIYALDFGGGDLTAGHEIYNRYGSQVITMWAAFTNGETYVLKGDGPEDFKISRVSANIGCPAPLTLASVEVGFEVAQDIRRNMLIWVSDVGPYMFDGQIMGPIKGIESYFDPDDPDYITIADIAKTVGWYDALHREYNILFPTDNLWVVYDLLKKKWFRKDPGDAAFPKVGFPVQDTDGIKYTYGAIDTGYMMRLENGEDWDGTPIDQVVETGDFWPTNNVWDLTRIVQLKFMAKRISEQHALTVQHYANTDDSQGLSGIWQGWSGGRWMDWEGGTWVSAALPSINLYLDDSINRIARDTIRDNLFGWSHRFRFSISTDETTKGFQPLGWGIIFRKENRYDE